MPEEKKKESFTFSDKIKSTQASGANKSFANRFTSKIGSDGKPRQTLFERTKRDAPFFIAALVALLLLPFLYKYSGQVEEDTPMVSPGYEDAIINPDRSGFDFSGDADGQISQLSGRDSMDLIVGWGKRHNEEEADASLADFYRSGLSDSSAKSDASSYKRSDMDEETNITNIYKRQRKQAPAQTRAAFRRAATKIGALKGAGLTGRGGGRLGIGHFGGGLKAAAQKVRGPGQVNSTKPVSLQPLQAAGKPSRSYFGQGAAQEARRSKDAMSKGNAMQALMDAQMKPVEPGRIGGLASGDFGGPGGGQGGLQRNFNYNGKEPWWWDMMKQRAQMEWQLWFDLKKSWIEFGSKLAQHWVEGLLNCLVMGDSDGDVDHFLGAGGGSGEPEETCCGQTASKLDPEKLKQVGGSVERYCKVKEWKASLTAALGGKCAHGGYKKKGGGASVRLSGWQQRWSCMGGHISAYAAGAPDIGLNTACSQLSSNHQYSVYPMGKARKWTKHTYHYIVARNYLPKAMEDFIKAHGGHATSSSRNFRLCDEASDKLQMTGKSSAGIRSYNDLDQAALDQRKALIEARDKCLEKKDKATNQEIDCSKEIEALNKFESEHFKVAKSVKKKTNPNARYQEEEVDPETLADSCVIYVGQGPTLEWNLRFKPELTALLRDIAAQYAPNATADELEQVAKRSFGQLDLLMISSMMAEEKLGAAGLFGSGNSLKKLPMAYWRFKEAYLDRYGVATKENGIYHHKVYKRKYRTEGEDVVYGATCMFDNSVKFFCEPNSNPAKATLEITEQYKAGVEEVNESELTVKAAYIPLTEAEKDKKVVPNFQIVPKVKRSGSATMYDLEFKNVIDRSGNKQDKPGTITWHVYRSGTVIAMDECDFENDGGSVSTRVEDDPCAAKGINTSEECCVKYGGPNFQWLDGKCQQKVVGGGNNPGGDPARGATANTVRLAPVLTWIPSNPTGRTPVAPATEPQKSHFNGGLIPGTDHEHCADNMGVEIINSDNATAFVKRVIAKYNEKNPNAPMADLATKYPTMGEFVDALNIAQAYGISETLKAPKDGVCLMARHIVRRSLDPHAEGLRWGNDNVFYNELGAYLAYVHEDAAYYPAKYYEQMGNCDKRFMAVNEGECVRNSQIPNNASERRWNFTNYGWNNNRASYKDSLNKLGIGTKYPLKALADDKSILAGSCTKACTEKREAYDSRFKNLLVGQCPTGEMEVADALSYVKDGVCKNGLYTKPWGSPGNSRGTVPVGNINSGNTQVEQP